MIIATSLVESLTSKAAKAMAKLKPYNLGSCSDCVLIVYFSLLGYHTLDLEKLHPPPADLRVRELDNANVDRVMEELKAKGTVGARLEIVCVVPPVSLLSLSLGFSSCL